MREYFESMVQQWYILKISPHAPSFSGEEGKIYRGSSDGD